MPISFRSKWPPPKFCTSPNALIRLFNSASAHHSLSLFIYVHLFIFFFASVVSVRAMWMSKRQNAECRRHPKILKWCLLAPSKGSMHLWGRNETDSVSSDTQSKGHRFFFFASSLLRLLTTLMLLLLSCLFLFVCFFPASMVLFKLITCRKIGSHNTQCKAIQNFGSHRLAHICIGSGSLQNTYPIHP